MRIRSLWLTISFFLAFPDNAASQSAEDEARYIFRLLTSTDLYPSDPRLATMTEKITAGEPLAAARIATQDKNFYNITLLNWAAPWSSTTGSVANPFEDLQALAVGLVRDRVDFRALLTGSVSYRGRSQIGLPGYSSGSNQHFLELGRSGLSLSDSLEQVRREDGRSIGVFGTRGFSSAYYDAGTNRRAVKFALEHFLCRPITAWRELQLPDTFVRRDVSRTPAGSIREYQHECRGCHAPMDALSGAFAFADHRNGGFASLAQVSPKYGLHADVFPDGFVTQNGRWINYLAINQGTEFGWRGPVEGSTLEEFASMLANSQAFSRCLSEKAVKAICPVSPSPAFLRELADKLEENQYDMRHLFEVLALHPSCRGVE